MCQFNSRSSIRPIQALLLFFFLWTTSPATAAPARYDENFLSTNYEDLAYSTAVWDTVLGEIRLPSLPFVEEGSWIDNAKWLVSGGNRVFAAVGGAIKIYDLTNPVAPVLEGSFDWLPQFVAPLCGAWDGRYLYVGTEKIISVFPLNVRHRLEIWDVSNPASSSFVGSIVVAGVPRDILVRSGVAWCALDTGGVVGFDVVDPTTPVAGPAYSFFGPAQQLATEGDMLYVGQSNSQGITSQRFLGGTALTNGPWTASGFNANDLQVEGSHLYVAADGYVDAYDLHTASSLPNSAIAFVASPALRVAADGPWMAAAESDGSVEIFERVGGQYVLRETISPATSTPNDLLRFGQHLLLASSTNGVRVVRFSQDLVGGAPVATGVTAIMTGGSGTNPADADVDQVGDRLFAVGSASSAGLRVYDVSGAGNPVQLGSYGTITSTQYSRVSARVGDVWVVDFDRVRGIDVSTPVVMSELSMIFVGAAASLRDVLVDGNTLYVLTKNDLRSYDISNPSAPSLLSTVTVQSPSNMHQIVASGRLLYLGDLGGGLGMRIIDASDPAALVEISYVATIRDVPQLAVEGNRLVAAGLSVAVYDLSDPLAPTYLGSSALPDWNAGARGLVVDGHRAYVTDLDNVLWVYDIAQPSAISRVGIYDATASTAADSWGLCLSGNQVYRYSWEVRNSILYQQVESIRVRERWLSTVDRRIVSKGLVFDTRKIRAVRLSATSTGAPVFRVENEEFYPGLTSLEVTPNGQWTLLDPVALPGNVFGKLRWVVDLISSVDGAAPTVSNLTVEWLLEEPTVDSWSDVPADEGGVVRLDWTRSGFDGSHTGTWPAIESYIVYRDPVALLRSKSVPAFVPASWDPVMVIPATGNDLYSAVVPVLADSLFQGGLTPRTHFVVQARPVGANSGFDSATVATFGIDNLDPAASTNLNVNYAPWDGPNVLSWAASIAPDVGHYRIYRALDPGLLDLTVVDSTATLSWSDPLYQQPGAYYAIDVVDDAGRTSPLTLTSTVTAATPLPSVTRLLPPAPNPFNPRTSIRFDLAEATDDLRLEVIDIRGRRVRQLLVGAMDAGSHSVVWNGRDDRGRGVGSGVYYLRFDAAGVQQVRKVVLAR